MTYKAFLILCSKRFDEAFYGNFRFIDDGEIKSELNFNFVHLRQLFAVNLASDMVFRMV